MAVCDPLHRQYELLPPIPDDLRASVEDPIRHNFCETFLAPDGDEETSFRVIWMVECRAKLIAFVFSSSTRQWRAISQSWTNLLDGLLSSTWIPLFLHRQYACGCFYWLPNWQWQHKSKMLVLDTWMMEFSIVEPPSEAKNSSSTGIPMFESGEGRPRMLVRGPDISSRSYTICRKNGGSSSQWQKEKIISLPLISWDMLRCAKGTYFLLDHRGSSSFEQGRFAVDIETLQLKRVCASTVHGHTYSNYPPSFSSPKVSSDIEEVLEQGVEALQAEGPVDGHQDESTAGKADVGCQADELRVGDGAY
ncbi:hypothetical protein CFC21_086259 [Triticum aestivum]|uniref:DUF1618 domain-containing protein n=2 Tax=Triticum aestivum TaxID=4565 RepID=A0A9R1IEQ0_WHEAT|nr:hypothetical protein CFC21_086259 [Triticum aestivum]